MKLNKYIDHTLLKANSTEEQIIKLCEEAKQYDFASVCVNTYWVKICKAELAGSNVNVCTVVGFPLGAMSTAAKAFEAQNAIDDGADEVDMVMNIGLAKTGKWDLVEKDMSAVREATRKHILKVIIECCLLSDEEKIKACKIAEKVGADFVKTSTGFSTGGAEVGDVRLMKKAVGERLKVKASGGIRSYEKCKEMIDAGASRIGTSSGIAIITEYNQLAGKE